MALPANVDTGLVRGRFIVGVIDGPDPDDEPDAIPATGTVTFTASVPYLPNPGASTTILKAPIVAVLDEEGWLCVRLPDGTAGARGVRLIATDDEDLSVTGWTWTVSYSFGAVSGITPRIETHSMALPTGATVDLTSVVKVPSSTGIGVEQAEALAASAQLAATEAAASAALAANAAHPTDTGVATLVTYGGETTAALDAQYRRDVTPSLFGAVGDGLTDDTAAVRAALNSGDPVNWGKGTYRITSPLLITATAPIAWESNGARVVADFPSPELYMIRIDAGGHDVDVRGALTVDAAKRAHTCIYFSNRFSRASLTATDLRATRAYRSIPDWIGGDGIAVGGGWDRVHLIRPTVTDIGMAAGAGASGTKGVSGIYVHEINKTGGADVPYDVMITDPTVEDVYSDDPAWKVDQDGIRVFGAPESVDTTLIRTTVSVIGGEVRNSLGRAMKFQTPHARVDGVKLVRTKGGQGATYDVDFQVGGGSLTNVECVYVDAAPVAVVQFSGERADETVPQARVAGVSVSMRGTAVMSRVVSVGALGEMVKSLSVRDVTVKGGSLGNVVLLAGISGGRIHLALSGVVAAVTDSFVTAQGGAPDGWDLDLTASSCINSGAVSVPLARSSTSAARIAAVSSALIRLT